MTAKNRQKNSEKGAASGQQDDAHKKNPPSASVSVAAHHGSSNSSSRCMRCLGLLASTVFYAALLGAAGFAAFHVQHAVEEMRESNAKQEESARQYSDIATKMVNVVHQVKGLFVCLFKVALYMMGAGWEDWGVGALGLIVHGKRPKLRKIY